MLLGGLPQFVSSTNQRPFCCTVPKLTWYEVPAPKLNMTLTKAVVPACETSVDVICPTFWQRQIGSAPPPGPEVGLDCKRCCRRSVTGHPAAADHWALAPPGRQAVGLPSGSSRSTASTGVAAPSCTGEALADGAGEGEATA